jgi:hypothetical protein
MPALAVGGLFSALSLLLIRVQISTAGADPSFYLGYVVDPGTHVERFGQTYHGNRIAYILPDAAFFALLGPEVGFFAVRFIALMAAVTCAYLIGERFGDHWSGLMIAATLAFVPWLPRQLLWTYPDGFATTYLLIGITALVVPRTDKVQRLGAVLAGLAFALGVNANLAALAVAGLFLPCWAWFRWADGTKRWLGQFAGVGLGFVGGSGTVGLVLRRLYPDGEAFPEIVALRVGLDVLGSDTWFVPFSALGLRAAYLLVVPVIIGMLVMVRGIRQDRTSPAHEVIGPAAGYLVAVGALGLVLHFGFENTWFAAPYYTIFHLPGVTLGTAALAGVVLHPLERSQRRAISVLSVVLLLVWFAVLPLPAAWDGPLAAMVLLGPLFVWSLGGRRSALKTLTVAIIIVSPFLGFAASHSGRPSPPETVAQRNALEWDIFRHSVALKRFIEANVDVTESVRFWHSTVGPDAESMRLLNMVFYGTGGGRFHNEKDGSGGMPALGPGQVAALETERPMVLVLLDPSEAGILAGLVALQLQGHVVSHRAELSLVGEQLRIEVAIIDIG